MQQLSVLQQATCSLHGHNSETDNYLLDYLQVLITSKDQPVKGQSITFKEFNPLEVKGQTFCIVLDCWLCGYFQISDPHTHFRPFLLQGFNYVYTE